MSKVLFFLHRLLKKTHIYFVTVFSPFTMRIIHLPLIYQLFTKHANALTFLAGYMKLVLHYNYSSRDRIPLE